MDNLNWNQIRAFLKTMEFGNMSAAARALGLAQPTIGRQIAGLEAELGVMLFDRIGTELRPTPLAHQLVARLRPMQSAVDDALGLTREQNETLRGEVSVTVTDIVARHIMPDVISRLGDLAPDLRINVISENAVQDIARRDADIAVRNVPPVQGALIVKKLGQSNAYFYGHRDYLARMGMPKHTGDLIGYRLIAYDDIAQTVDQLGQMGFVIPPEGFRAATNDGNLVFEMTKRGYGLAILPDMLADREPDLVRVMPEEIHITFGSWITTRAELRTNPRIRLVFDVMSEIVGNALAMR